MQGQACLNSAEALLIFHKDNGSSLLIQTNLKLQDSPITLVLPALSDLIS